MDAALGDDGAGSYGMKEKFQAPLRLDDARDVGEIVGGRRVATTGHVKGALTA